MTDQQIVREWDPAEGRWSTHVQAEGGGGGSQPGAVIAADFVFTEVADSATYSASLPIEAGTTVLDVILYCFGQWVADYPAPLTIGDTMNGASSYLATDATGLNTVYDPVSAAIGASWNDLAAGGNLYANVAWNASDTVGPNGPGVYYEADDEIVLLIVTSNAVPVVPAGVTRIRVLYQAPVTATDADVVLA